jgi:hypothetical protein
MTSITHKTGRNLLTKADSLAQSGEEVRLNIHGVATSKLKRLLSMRMTLKSRISVVGRVMVKAPPHGSSRAVQFMGLKSAKVARSPLNDIAVFSVLRVFSPQKFGRHHRTPFNHGMCAVWRTQSRPSSGPLKRPVSAANGSVL